jgi:aspartyl protease family protein
MERRADPAVARRRRGGYAMLAIAWLLVFAIGWWWFDAQLERAAHPNPAEALAAGAGGEVTLRRNRAGHYVAGGEINGTRVTFLLDTGATQVALPPRVASQLGLERGPAVRLVTANGTTTGYRTRLAEVRLGPIVVRDVAAVVAEGLEEPVVLLGMSFLQRVEFTQRGDNLILRLP